MKVECVIKLPMHKFQRIKTRTILLLICSWIFLFGFYVFQVAGLLDDNTDNDEQAAAYLLSMPLDPTSKDLKGNIIGSLTSLSCHFYNVIFLVGIAFALFSCHYSFFQTAPNCKTRRLFQLFSNYRI